MSYGSTKKHLHSFLAGKLYVYNATWSNLICIEQTYERIQVDLP